MINVHNDKLLIKLCKVLLWKACDGFHRKSPHHAQLDIWKPIYFTAANPCINNTWACSCKPDWLSDLKLPWVSWFHMKFIMSLSYYTMALSTMISCHHVRISCIKYESHAKSKVGFFVNACPWIRHHFRNFTSIIYFTIFTDQITILGC